MLVVDQIALVAAQKSLAVQLFLGLHQSPRPAHRAGGGVVDQLVAADLQIPDLPQQQPLESVGLGHQNGLAGLLPPGQGPAQLEGKAAVLHRLDQVVHGVHLVALHRKPGHIGDKQQNGLPIHFPQPPGGLHAVHAGQFDVHKHHIKGGIPVQKGDGIPKQGDVELLLVFLAILPQISPQLFRRGGIVLYDRDLHPSTLLWGRLSAVPKPLDLLCFHDTHTPADCQIRPPCSPCSGPGKTGFVVLNIS